MPKILLPIPKNSKLEVKVNDKVQIGSLLAVVEKEPEPKVLNLAKLGVSLILPVGSKVEKGQVIAQKEKLLSFSKTVVFSPVSGRISFFNDKLGELFIEEKSTEKREIKSKLEGRILSISEDGLEIETKNKVFLSDMGLGKDAEGELVFPTLLDSGIRDKIIMVQSPERLTLSKAFGLGAVGLVASTINGEDLTYFKERGFDFPILTLAQDVFLSLKEFLNKRILLFPEQKMLVVL